jgi:hypothetical protein
MLLIESILSEEVKLVTEEMDTITEYLVLTPGVSISEGAALIRLIEADEKSAVAKLVDSFKAKKQAIITAFNKRIALAQQNLMNAKRGAKYSLADKIMVKIGKLKTQLKDALEALAKKYKGLKAAAATKAAKSKTLVKLSQFAAKHPKMVKAGKVGALVGAGAVGYAAYKKRKKG